MVVMESYYSSNQLQEVWQAIDQLHYRYLDLEESEEKLDHRIELEKCIRQYLCVAADAQKFFLRETREVLYRSAMMKKDFSGYKAASGWNAIQLYAGNLLSQPWRKEYRQIKTYCGFYKHQVEANLVGAELMFEIMGYKHCGNGILVLDGPICPDRVASVSKDCLIAHVECQILKAIWEEVTPSFKISWLDVLHFRQKHPCSPEQAIRALGYQYQPSHLSRTHSAPYAPLPKPYLYGTNCCGSYPAYNYTPYPNGLYTNGFSQQTQANSYSHPVPTGNLIEVDSHQNSYDVVDFAPKTKTAASVKNKEQDFESWDYVYRNLESQGYSKDLGERGDILNAPSQKKLKSTNIDEAMKNMVLADCENERRNRRLSDSSYENVSEAKKPVVSKAEKRRTSVIKEKLNNGDKWECKFCTILNDSVKDVCSMCSKSKVTVDQQMEIGGPQCSKCTLVNSKDRKDCQACGHTLKNSPTYI